jgi:hypothetical protein
MGTTSGDYSISSGLGSTSKQFKFRIGSTTWLSIYADKSVIFLVKTGYLSIYLSLNAVTINTSGVSTVNNPQRMGQLSQDLKIEPSIFSTQPHILLISLIKSVMKV